MKKLPGVDSFVVARWLLCSCFGQYSLCFFFLFFEEHHCQSRRFGFMCSMWFCFGFPMPCICVRTASLFRPKVLQRMPLHETRWPPHKCHSTAPHGLGALFILSFISLESFDFLPSRVTKFEEELLRYLRKAMVTTPTTETDMNVTADRLPSCQPDVGTCPIGWVRRGVRCMAEGRNEGVSFSRRGALVSFALSLSF